VVAMMAACNEERFIGHCLEHPWKQSAEAYLTDNGSTDRTARSPAATWGAGWSAWRPSPRRGGLHVAGDPRAKRGVPRHPRDDWFMHPDPDEFRLAHRPDLTLAEAPRTKIRSSGSLWTPGAKSHTGTVRRTSPAACSIALMAGRNLAEENAWLKAELEEARERIVRLEKRVGPRPVRASDILWVFGAGRTGSTWVSNIMAEMPDHEVWFEPMLGDLFDAVRLQVGERPGEDFVFSKHYRRTWRRSVKNFVLDGAAARFPQGAGVLVIKEPHGSAGAPVLSVATPESRFVLLVRDPRDAVASALDRYLNGPWRWQGSGGGWGMYRGEETDPDGFVERAARRYTQHVMMAEKARKSHHGPKCLVRYEDLLADTVGEMRRVYNQVDIEYRDSDLAEAVEKCSYANVPEKEKGPGKRVRRATAGSYAEDLTLEQVGLVERECASIFETFYVA